ncbi:MAG: hypothetical protein RBT80_28610 [Candidatus Vecturithrix sp.]|jgi:hypothetical protein|nr:hypothetical protein [Candidatus Vecturithrix sp.]
MLIPVNRARIAAPHYWWALPFINAAIVAIFLVTLHKDITKSEFFLYALGCTTLVSIFMGIFATFRFTFDSIIGLWTIFYCLMMGFLFSCSTSVFVMDVADRSDLRILALSVNVLFLACALLAGMYFEAKGLNFFGGANHWREEIDKYINYPKHEVSPSLTGDTANYREIKHPYILLGIGIANVPLLFELYGGGKVNAIFLAAPGMTLILSYLNFRTIGPALTRLLLLRRIEKEVGYRFQNADYEQIQELRRGFFLARWLMKDYRPPQTESTCFTASGNRSLQMQTKQKRKKKK